jgi:hypothetical protein
MNVMNFIKSLLISTVILAVPAIGSAQASLQSGGSPEQQSSNAQNTGQLQTGNASPVQNNKPGEALTQNQPSSLGVVGDPSQTSPSVTVGESTSSAQDTTKQKTRNYLPITVVVVAIMAAVAGFLSYRNSSPAVEPVEEPEPVVNKPKKPKKKAASASGKKKKKAHR